MGSGEVKADGGTKGLGARFSGSLAAPPSVLQRTGPGPRPGGVGCAQGDCRCWGAGPPEAAVVGRAVAVLGSAKHRG